MSSIVSIANLQQLVIPNLTAGPSQFPPSGHFEGPTSSHTGRGYKFGMLSSSTPAMGQTLTPRVEEFSFGEVRPIEKAGFDSRPTVHHMHRTLYASYKKRAGTMRQAYSRHSQGSNPNPPQPYDYPYPYHTEHANQPIYNFIPTLTPNQQVYNQDNNNSRNALGLGGASSYPHHPYPQQTPTLTHPHSNGSSNPQYPLGAHEQKTNTIHMPNCRQLGCQGSTCSCMAPEDALWGSSPHDVTTCQWYRTAHGQPRPLRNVDPQLVRPRDKTSTDNTRPSGHPYFTHESRDRACVPYEAPLAQPASFNYHSWLSTVPDREPPAHLQGQCIGTVCTLCGPLTVECCPHYNNPLQYTLAKKSC